MNERTVAFLAAGVTVGAWMIFWHGLIGAWAHSHPDSAWAHGLTNILTGTGSHDGEPAAVEY
jgi:hypothetical protein